jgi:tetraacyldisaccharide 4'-kinase
VKWRNRGFDRGRRRIERVNVPVISVGNLSLGGTGKTPLVEWLARWLRSRGVRVTLVSRGYGAEAGARNDEALELEERLPDVPHLQNPDRVAAARTAIEEFECQCIVLDDGFQHRRLARDLDLVLIDALEPFGFGHVFPRGTLREPLAGLARAQAVALSRADLVEVGEREQIKATVGRYAPRAVWLELAHAPRRLVSSAGQEQSLDGLRGRRVAAFCGIGNPAGFRRTLEGLGAALAEFREFPDHYAYRRADIDSLAAWGERLGAEALVCTAKDLVKLRVEQIGRLPLWSVAIELEIMTGQSELEALLEPLLP